MMKKITMILLLAVITATAVGIEEYLKIAGPLYQEKKLDAYGNMRYEVICRFNSMINGTFYNNFPELKELAVEDLSRIINEESRRLKVIKSGKQTYTAVPVRKKDEYPHIAGAHFEQNVIWPDGKVEKRPVFLFGFGVFQTMRNDVDFLGRLGINYSQGEIGPSHIYPQENVYSDKAVKNLERFLGKAEKYGMLMDLLISPHYIPKWFFEKNPDANRHLGGFLRVGINRPATMQLMRDAYGKALPELAKYPAIFSLAITNEPVAFIWHGDVDTPRLWLGYLQKKYCDIRNLNSKWDTEYKDFKDIKPVLAPPKVPFEFDSRIYDWMDFNAQRLAGWIGELGEVVGHYLPDKPQHSKMIQRNFRQYDLMQGVDVFYFSRNGSMNGFDGGVNFRSPLVSFNRAGEIQAMLLGCRKAPLLNTEHHLLRDRNHDPVPAGYIRAAYLHQALTGLSASIAWNWDYDGSNHDSIFAGSFRYRPGATEEYVRTGFDLMRLAPEVVAISEQEPQVGILYSRTNLLWNPDSENVFHEVYAAVSGNGINPVIIPDQVLASGKVMEKFPQLSVLILPDIQYLPDEAYSQLEVFAKSGFHSNRGVLVVGNLPRMTPYGKKRSVALFDDTAVTAEFVKNRELAIQRIGAELNKFSVRPLAAVYDHKDKISEQVFFRAAVFNGKIVGAAINLGEEPVELHWKKHKGNQISTFMDMAGLDKPDETGKFILNPWEVRLGYLN